MRSIIFLASIVSFALACGNPDTDACASVFTVSSADAATFCATYTTASVTHTTDLPAYATYCSMKPKKLSSACSCLVAQTTLQTITATSTAASGTDDSCDFEEPSSTIDVSANAPTSVVGVLTTKVTYPTSVADNAHAAAVGNGTACTATEYAQITSVVASCTNIVLENISAPASSTIDLSALQTGSTVTFAGTTSFGTTSDDDFDPIVVGGTDITLTGAEGHVIDGNGAVYWDGEGSNGGVAKPDHFIVLKDLKNGHISNLNIQNWPVHCFDITGADGLIITGLTLDNSAGDASNSASDGKAAAHNSDGFDFSSCSNVILSDTVVKNQDDCVAVTSGTNITMTGMTCSGGHGLSIGSVGGKSNNVVSGITFSNSTVTDSENGCRIKSNADKSGTIENILYQNIALTGITDYGIDVQQDYLNGGATGDPTNGVTISGVTFSNVTGTVTSDGRDYYVLCGSSSCSNFTFTNVAISGGGKTSTCNFPSTGCPS
ncbi:glycoside hydrolase family 28 protein [Hyaloscypha variabilis F]|uniref:endo-polygalacturonase n=1 Tax=Hyaloscypha variabilis (strain UAMH 11265 / GT02V1 / F) TaxID=1149755 RepID=A0A2J6RSU6_HYAVF|nr:glycoside hydrolase family 28 protein [Hyaloscypha variabilis F]